VTLRRIVWKLDKWLTGQYNNCWLFLPIHRHNIYHQKLN